MRGSRTNPFGLSTLFWLGGLALAAGLWLNPHLLGDVSSLLRMFLTWASEGLKGATFWIAILP